MTSAAKCRKADSHSGLRAMFVTSVETFTILKLGQDDVAIKWFGASRRTARAMMVLNTLSEYLHPPTEQIMLKHFQSYINRS